jgi:hypothetical protein
MPEQPQAPVAGGPAPVEKANAPGAVASLVCGIIGLIICGLILGAVALSMALKAKKAIKENPDMYKGGGMATAGLVLGIIDIVGWAIYIVIRIAAR